METTIQDFIIGEVANANSPQAVMLAYQIKQAIVDCKDCGNKNQNAFSVDVRYKGGAFFAQVSFSEDPNMTTLYKEDTDNETVASIFLLNNHKELCRLAGLLLDAGWVEGYNT